MEPQSTTIFQWDWMPLLNRFRFDLYNLKIIGELRSMVSVNFEYIFAPQLKQPVFLKFIMQLTVNLYLSN